MPRPQTQENAGKAHATDRRTVVAREGRAERTRPPRVGRLGPSIAMALAGDSRELQERSLRGVYAAGVASDSPGGWTGGRRSWLKGPQRRRDGYLAADSPAPYASQVRTRAPTAPQPGRIVEVAERCVRVRTDGGDYVEVLRAYVDPEIKVRAGAMGMLAYGPIPDGFGYWFLSLGGC